MGLAQTEHEREKRYVVRNEFDEQMGSQHAARAGQRGLAYLDILGLC